MINNKITEPIILTRGTKEFTEIAKDTDIYYIVKGKDKILKFTSYGLVIEYYDNSDNKIYNFSSILELKLNYSNGSNEFIVKIENKEIVIRFEINDFDRIVEMYKILNEIGNICRFINKYQYDSCVKSLALQVVESYEALNKEHYLKDIIEKHKLKTNVVELDFSYIYEKYLGGK